MSKESESSSKQSESSSGNTWTCSLRVYARPIDVYNAFVDPRDIMRYTRAPAEAKLAEGGEFSQFDGAIHGEFVTLKKGEKIVMKWRFKTWADGVYSTVTLDLSEAGEGVTDVSFKQTGIPSSDSYGNRTVMTTTTEGWKKRIFMGIKMGLGYGLDVEE